MYVFSYEIIEVVPKNQA